MATKRVGQHLQHHETRIRPVLRSSGTSSEEMDERKDSERKDRDGRKNSKISYETLYCERTSFHVNVFIGCKLEDKTHY
jgi:hypothetical protein